MHATYRHIVRSWWSEEKLRTWWKYERVILHISELNSNPKFDKALRFPPPWLKAKLWECRFDSRRWTGSHLCLWISDVIFPKRLVSNMTYINFVGMDCASFEKVCVWFCISSSTTWTNWEWITKKFDEWQKDIERITYPIHVLLHTCPSPPCAVPAVVWVWVNVALDRTHLQSYSVSGCHH